MDFQSLNEILTNEFGLESKHSKNGEKERYSYFFKDRHMDQKRSQVFCDIRQLKNGGIGGYIYINHLREYDKDPKKTKMGHLAIGNMSIPELREITTKATKEYK